MSMNIDLPRIPVVVANTNFPFVTRLTNETFIAHSSTGAKVGVTQNLRTAQLLIENAYAGNTSVRWSKQVDQAGVERWIALTDSNAVTALAAAQKAVANRTTPAGLTQTSFAANTGTATNWGGLSFGAKSKVGFGSFWKNTNEATDANGKWRLVSPFMMFRGLRWKRPALINETEANPEPDTTG